MVTGGASGLGAATAAQLRNAGARVRILDQDEDRARTHAKAIGATWCAVDVADGPAVQAAIEDLENLRVLVCCAGIGGGMAVVRRNGPHDLETFERVIRVNLTGTFNCVRLAAWKMSQLEPTDDDERGVIITTASIAGYDGVDGGAAYSASKAGVAGMTLPLARDLGRFGVRVMSIAPGTFTTPMTAGMPADFDSQMRDTTPFPHRFGNPSEYASLVEHIVSNHMLNGEVIRLDGGLRMTPSRFR